ncbi:VWA domain-containing protein [Propioniciclava tarda]|uniref:VWA domain-containing protein n=1 Tax=Propioniciclava tarda TaxID=433330 RepID=UPI00116FBA26|nr:VWA domain-containing protein [Propioniciclava tarda]SMO68688.1 Ca-activated chloride channel family protein [Propioniciclava tarda]
MNLDDVFLNPERLWWWIVVPVMVALYIWIMRRKRRTAMRYTNTAVLGAVIPRQSQWRRHLAVAMSLASLVTIIAAWARPNGVERVPRERATIVLVIDVSQSMRATDVKPNRLDAAKQLSKEFVSTLPPKYNVAVVSLSGSPAVKLPPSTDRGLALRAIDGLTTQDSTAVGPALQTALAAVQMAPKGDNGEPAPGAVVLLSDGANTATESPLQAAQALAKAKIPVYTIAYGTENGSVDLDGVRERVPPDRELMQQIANATKGTFSSAESAGQLDNVYKNLSSQVGFEEVKKETTAMWAGYGLAFAVVAALAAVSLGARWP